MSAASSAARPPWFPALVEPHVRLYLFGQTVSMLGSWVLDITLSLLVWQLTKSPALLGLLNFLIYVPGIVVTPLFSAQLTAVNARRRTLWVLTAALLVALTLTVLMALNWLTMPVILVLAALRGVLNGMEVPSRQMLLASSVKEPERIASAVALSTVSFHAARMCGPAIAGVFFGTAGALWGFGLAVAALLVMLGCVWYLPRTPAPRPAAASVGRGGLAGALDFVRGDRFSRLFLPVTICVGLFAGAYQTLVPVLADRVFGDTAHWTAGFFAAVGLGGLAAALLLSTHLMPAALRRLLVVVPWFIALAFLGIGLSRQPWLVLLCFGMVGFGMSFVGTCTNAEMQQRVPSEVRGGLIALFLMSFVGAIPISQLLAGLLAQSLTVQGSFLVLAVVLFVGLLLLFMPRWWALGRLELNAEKI
ncbi:MAG: MFS transporter [Sulfuricaulis sp.]|nr:MFS transporter [Sulfuricaulis sp.]